MELLGHALLAIVLHELGHALAAWSVGARVHGFRVRGGVRTLIEAPAGGWSRGAFSVVMAAGVVANLLSAVVLWNLWSAIHLVCAIANLVPTEGSDGRALWIAARGLTLPVSERTEAAPLRRE